MGLLIINRSQLSQSRIPCHPPTSESLFCLSPAAECCFWIFLLSKWNNHFNFTYWELPNSMRRLCVSDHNQRRNWWAPGCRQRCSDLIYPQLEILPARALGSPGLLTQRSVEGEQGWWWGKSPCSSVICIFCRRNNQFWSKVEHSLMSLCTDVQKSGVNEDADNASFSSTKLFQWCQIQL